MGATWQRTAGRPWSPTNRRKNSGYLSLTPVKSRLLPTIWISLEENAELRMITASWLAPWMQVHEVLSRERIQLSHAQTPGHGECEIINLLPLRLWQYCHTAMENRYKPFHIYYFILRAIHRFMFLSVSANSETDFREFKHPASIYPPRKCIE